MGIASALLICLWIYNEVSYDRFHKNKANLYQAYNRGMIDNTLQCWSAVPKPLAAALKSEFANIENSCRVDMRWFVTGVGDNKMSTKALVADPSFLSMFTYPMLYGDKSTALKDIYCMVVTESFARKMFGKTDVIGKAIRIDGDDLLITGVLKDIPTNSQFSFEYILPWEYYKKIGNNDEDWGNNSVAVYVQTKPGVPEEEINAQIRNITRKHTANKEDLDIFLHPLSKWRLYTGFENGKATGGRIETVTMFGIIAGFLLLIACINFMNLSTARSQKRAKEVGIRKVTGAVRTSLITQFLLESIIVAALAGILSVLLVLMVLPAFNTLMGKELILPYNSVVFWLAFAGFILFTGILAGSYPAFFLSSFNPVGVLKGHFKKTGTLVTPRKVLVVFQFCIAIVLIISTIIVARQIRFARNRNAGYAKSALAYHWMTPESNKNYQLLKRDILASGNVISVARTAAQLTEQFSSTTAINWSGKDPNDNTEIERSAQDEGLIKTAELKLVQGRDFDLTQFPTDSTGILINQSAANHMGFKNPIGQLIREGDMEYHVVGVFEDYIFGSPYERTKPMVIFGSKGMWFNIIYMRLKPTGNISKQVEAIGAIFKKYAPSYPFECHFVDQDYARKFDDLELTSRLTGLFAALTIFITCLGLFGLASYMAETRIKEIGIRKVLGASGISITSLLSKDFIVLIVISLLLACPVAWFAMNSWLNGYSYRTSIEWWVFAATGLFAMLIAIATVSYHSIRAILSNPVKSLRTE